MAHISNFIDDALTHDPKPIKTGYKFLDNTIGGYYPGEVTTIGGWEDNGKTAFVITQLNRIAVDQKTPTLLVLDYIKVDYFIALMASYYCCISVMDIHTLLFSPFCRDAVSTYLDKLKEAPLYIVDVSSSYPEDIDFEMIGKIVKENGIKIMFYDQVKNGSKQYGSGICHTLKNASVKWNIPVVAVCCIWNMCEGEGSTRLSLMDFSRYAGYHNTDVVLTITDYEKHAIFMDDCGRNLRGKVMIEILKCKGLTGKLRAFISRQFLLNRRETLELKHKEFIEEEADNGLTVKSLIENLELYVENEADGEYV